MANKNREEYRGFNKDLKKEDLNKEELEYYNKLMSEIDYAYPKEKDEVAHLMNIYLETEEETLVNCIRCSKEFVDNYEDLNEGNKRIYCDDCLRKMWAPIN